MAKCAKGKAKPKKSSEKKLKEKLETAEKRAEMLAEKLNKALVVESKKSLVKPPFDLKVMLKMAERTNPRYVKVRQGPGGSSLRYVEGGYMKTALNYLFGWRWDFEIIDKGEVKVSEKVVEVWTQGKLTIRDEQNNPVIVKTQFGGCPVKYLKSNPDMPVSMSNDFKASATDCLKKCASELGIASDVYNANEFIMSEQEAKPKQDEVIEGQVADNKPSQVDYYKKLIEILAKDSGSKEMSAMLKVFNTKTGRNLKKIGQSQELARQYLLDYLNN